MATTCRMYEARFPDVDDVVMVEVKNIVNSMGVYVSLLEYNHIDGLILTRRIRSITQLVRVGRIEPAMVLRVDKTTGYIDLSKRRVDGPDAAACAAKYNKSKAVHSIVCNVAHALKRDLEETYRAVWPLYATYDHAYDAFQRLAALPVEGDPSTILGPMDAALTDALMKDIRHRMTPQPLKIRANVEMTCFGYDGVLRIQDAMRAALREASAVPITFKLIAAPLYILTAQTMDAAIGVVAITEAIRAATAVLAEAGGTLVVKGAPHVMSEREDAAMQQKIENFAKEVGDGDQEEDPEIEGMGEGLLL